MFYVALIVFWMITLPLIAGIPIAIEWWRAGQYLKYLEKRWPRK